MDPARPSSTGVTWGTAATAVREGDRARLQQIGAPHSINVEPLDTDWGRHRRPDQKEQGEAKPRKRERGPRRRELRGLIVFGSISVKDLGLFQLLAEEGGG